MTLRVVYKSAKSGEFVSKEEYLADPETTFAETVNVESGEVVGRDREHIVTAPTTKET